LATDAAVPVFTRNRDTFVPSAHARGPWDPAQQHGGAPSALLARAIEALVPGLRLARLTVEFHGPVPLAPVTVAAAIVRPGRRLALAEAELRAGERVACRARGVLLRRGEATPSAGALGPPPPVGPDAAGPTPFDLAGEGFAVTAMELRTAAGGAGPGPATVWLRLRRPLVAGEAPSPVQRAAAAADFGNGISAEVSWDDWLFVNTDLTVALARDPVGAWIALHARTRLDPGGAGLATSILHDESGALGVAAQTLFVAPRG
jgi:hypothetical protein